MLREEVGEVVLVCEHEPTIAMGVRATDSHILWSPEELAARGVQVCATPRGGEATLHAPGQLVVYPLMAVGRRIRAHIEAMADAARSVCAAHGVDDLEFRWEHPGLWRKASKLASVGVHVRRGVCVQGLSLNIDVAPELYAALVSCGMPDVEMASLARQPECEDAPTVEAAGRAWADAFALSQSREQRWISRDALRNPSQ